MKNAEERNAELVAPWRPSSATNTPIHRVSAASSTVRRTARGREGSGAAGLGRPASAGALGPLVRICAASRYLAAPLAARPRLIDLLPLLAIRTRTAQEALAAAVRHAHAPDAEALARRLRRHKLVEV